MSRNQFNTSVPILLSSTITLPTVGFTPPLDSIAMSEPFRKAIWIDEIRWTAVTYDDVSARGPFGGLRVSLKLGDLALTNTRSGDNFVPILNLVPVIQGYEAGEGQQGSLTDASVLIGVGQFTWRFPRPLYVPAGGNLSAKYQQTSEDDSRVKTLVTTYAGRYANPDDVLPSRVAVPFATVWETTGQTGVTVVKSSDLDLVNPFNSTLYTQRMIGRIISASGGDYGAGSQIPGTIPTSEQGILIEDSVGRVVSRDFAPFNNILDGIKRSWIFESELAPRERINVTLNGMQNNQNVYVSLIGYRYEELR